MNPIYLSRRKLITAATGLAVTGTNFLSAETSAEPDPLGKELIFRTNDPRNGEPALSRLVQSWITPVKDFYVRSHAPNPEIDAGKYLLKVEGLVAKPLTLDLSALKRFKRHKVVATLTCAGNRRTEFNSEAKVGGVQWEAGAIGNAEWSGFALSDVLKKAGLQDQAKHVWFEGLDKIQRKETTIPFGGSIPLEKVMQVADKPEALLADQMNGQTLPADHGYPLRAVVPGYIGARSVKWLGKIIVSDRPSPNHYLANAYKIVKSTSPIDLAEAGPIYRYPINGAIATPEAMASVSHGLLDVTGYVLPTGRPDTQAQRIEISSDNGLSWQAAQTFGKTSEYCWQLWKARIPVSTSTTFLTLRAFDSSGGFMPRRVPWNAKGYLQNSWYRLPIKVS
ncbi:MAG: hypothetical protein CMJ76_12825 [Planctomycetaceae bacterium]|nr:hypothetical protein [Planctomycetaceae bacterium]